MVQEILTQAKSNEAGYHNVVDVPVLNMTCLTQLKEHCSRLYPHQSQLLQCIRPIKSFVFGGTDALDFISIFRNDGDPEHNIPMHWHYVGFGLSDLYGYNLIYDMMSRSQELNQATNFQELPRLYPPSSEGLCGFGFELTFRVRCNSNDWSEPAPRWPTQVMQALANYVFKSKNIFRSGDHAAWHRALDGEGESRIRHLLMTMDPQLGQLDTSQGGVRFIQLVGVCEEELQAAREWNVNGILDLMRDREETGGQLLVTDMTRGETIFELEPQNRVIVESSIIEMGSDMAQVSLKHKASASKPDWFKEAEHSGQVPDDEVDICNSTTSYCQANQIHDTGPSELAETGCFDTMTRDDTVSTNANDYNPCSRVPSRMSYESESALMIEYADINDTRYFESAYLLMNVESAKLWPLINRGRLAHKRHFSFQNFTGDLTTTFIPEGATLEASMVKPEHPIAKRCNWLQILVPERLRLQMESTIPRDIEQEVQDGPKNYCFPEFKLYITITKEIL